MKIMIISLDGATWDVLDDYLLQNHMPYLNKLKTEGASGVLRSTEPPTTCTAWTSFLTGCNPQKHGILGYEKYSFDEDSLSLVNSTHCRVPLIWQQLSKQGYKLVSINVPWTYPCPEVNGIIVAGYGCPGPDSQFTYPKEFREQILSEIPDYDITSRYVWSESDDLDSFRYKAEKVKRSFEQKLQAAHLCSSKVAWDIMMVQIQDIDTMHHRIWPYVGADIRDKHPDQRDILFGVFEYLDKIISELLKCAKEKDLFTIVVSDHGGCNLNGVIRPNVLLHKWGYLKFQSVLHREFNRIRRHWRYKKAKDKNTLDIKKAKTRQPSDLNIDWNRTKAVVLHRANNAYVYINLRNRNKEGFVELGDQYNTIIKELKKNFSKIKDSNTGQHLFRKVVTPEELYGESESISNETGDLILIPVEGYDTRTTASRGRGYLEPARYLEGSHSYNGIYILSGANVKSANSKQADIIDMAPTIYALLGAKMPTYVDGSVLQESFTKSLDVQFMEPENFIDTKKTFKFSESEERKVSERLKELGYL